MNGKNCKNWLTDNQFFHHTYSRFYPYHPITELLENSIYYPSSHFDGAVVKAYVHGYQSFVYCDYGVTEDELVAQLQTFRGYDVLAHRSAQKEELMPNGWEPQIPRHLLANYGNTRTISRSRLRTGRYMNASLNITKCRVLPASVCSMSVVRASLRIRLYTGVTGPQLKLSPSFGPALGFNWTNFLGGEKALGYVVTQNPHRQPNFIISNSRQLLKWRSYPYPTNERFCRFDRTHLGYFYEYTLSR